MKDLHFLSHVKKVYRNKEKLECVSMCELTFKTCKYYIASLQM
jgi:hypothetical protein